MAPVIDLIWPFAVTSPQIPNRGWPCSGDLKKPMLPENQCPSPHDRPYPAKNTSRVRNTLQQTQFPEKTVHVTVKSSVEYTPVYYTNPQPPTNPKNAVPMYKYTCTHPINEEIFSQYFWSHWSAYLDNVFQALKIIFLILFTSPFISKYYTCQVANQSYSFQIRK